MFIRLLILVCLFANISQGQTSADMMTARNRMLTAQQQMQAVVSPFHVTSGLVFSQCDTAIDAMKLHTTRYAGYNNNNYIIAAQQVLKDLGTYLGAGSLSQSGFLIDWEHPKPGNPSGYAFQANRGYVWVYDKPELSSLALVDKAVLRAMDSVNAAAPGATISYSAAIATCDEATAKCDAAKNAYQVAKTYCDNKMTELGLVVALENIAFAGWLKLHYKP